MQQRFRDTARKETDNDIPDKMKHDFLLLNPASLEIKNEQCQNRWSQAMQTY
jgi:hypothetical protein